MLLDETSLLDQFQQKLLQRSVNRRCFGSEHTHTHNGPVLIAFGCSQCMTCKWKLPSHLPPWTDGK